MKKKYKNQAHLLMWVTVLCALLINVGCIPSDVVKIDFKNVVENKVYNVTPNIMLDYTVGGKHAETAGNSKEFNDFIRNRVTVRVNSTDVTKYFKFEKYTAILKNKTAFTEHFIPGRNHITINNTADETSPYGKKERIINEMIIEYTNGEADISITKFEPIGNYIDVEGYASNGNLPIVISINDVYAEQEENGMFYAKIPAATSYQVKVKTLGSKTTVKQ